MNIYMAFHKAIRVGKKSKERLPVKMAGGIWVRHCCQASPFELSMGSTMRTVFLTRPGFLLLCAACIFVIGNIILLYKFVGKPSLKYGDNLVKDYGHHFVPKGRVGEIHAFAKHHIRQKQEGKGTKEAGTTSRNDEDDHAKLVAQDVNNVEIINSETQREERGSIKTDAGTLDRNKYVIAVLVIACNRPTVKRCIDQLLKYRPSTERFPVIVSQDCGHVETAAAIRSYGPELTLIEQPVLSAVDGVPGNMQQFMGYYKISRHYKWALGQLFDKMGYESVVIVEDDLDIAPDFFEYFMATRPLLDKDPTLWCVSAWNDNGKEGMVEGNDILYRTDFFPGLGWMLKKSLWEELKPKWPLGFWDDWMRDPSQRKGRACIRPEICRTKTFGRIGVSHGQFYDEHLQYIKLNDKAYPFSKSDLSYLLQENYDESFVQEILNLPDVNLTQLSGKTNATKVQIRYKDEADFSRLAQSLGPMKDFKAGVPRMAYKGVVTVMFKGIRVYIVPHLVRVL